MFNLATSCDLKLCNTFGFQWLYRLSVEEVAEHDFMLPLSEAEVRP